MKSASAGKIRVSAAEDRSVGGIAAMVIEQSATMPIGAPVAPPPAKPCKKPDAYAQAGIRDPRHELAMAEVHDCFTPTELVLMEDLGFATRGTAWKEAA